MCKGFGRSEYRIFKTNPSQIQILATFEAAIEFCAATLQQDSRKFKEVCMKSMTKNHLKR